MGRGCCCADERGVWAGGAVVQMREGCGQGVLLCR